MNLNQKKIELFQQILKEKWYLGSNVSIFDHCAFCEYNIVQKNYCINCMIRYICGEKEGNLGEKYNAIVQYVHKMEGKIEAVGQLPTELLQDFITSIETEIARLQAEMK